MDHDVLLREAAEGALVRGFSTLSSRLRGWGSKLGREGSLRLTEHHCLTFASFGLASGRPQQYNVLLSVHLNARRLRPRGKLPGLRGVELAAQGRGAVRGVEDQRGAVDAVALAREERRRARKERPVEEPVAWERESVTDARRGFPASSLRTHAAARPGARRSGRTAAPRPRAPRSTWAPPIVCVVS